MSSAMISQTLQGMVLSITSNVLAQAITAYRDEKPFSIDFSHVFTFAFFSILSNPPNIIWQNFLEYLFPTNVPLALPPTSSEKANGKPITLIKTRTSKTNILIKFLMDQTFGSVLNTVMFVTYIGYVNNQGKPGVNAWRVVVNDLIEKTWPMMKNGYKFWPAVSFISFVWVPVHKRVVFGCSVGVLWGIYLSLVAGA